MGQAQAYFKILQAGYTPMTPLFHKADGSWTCFAMKQAAMYSVEVDPEGSVDATPL
jgi:hypothetical protein